MLERRKALGGFLPQRRRKADASFAAPELAAFEPIAKGSGEREISTTMAFVRGINLLLRDKAIGPRVVPIVADEARTFGMEGMFRQIGIYAPFGQKYKPQDADQLMYYREDQKGQVLQEGISEAGAMSAWMAAATSYSISNLPMLPFYIYYSMFGFQRIGDLCWAAGDMRARGFLRRRHRRAHHAQRRRPAARGRPFAPAGRRDPELPRLRSDVLVRSRGDPAGRHAPHAARAGGHATTTSP